MEGIIKFNACWNDKTIISVDEFDKINPWRNKLYHQGLIGIASDGIAFGNISHRVGETSNFIITASATGGLKLLYRDDYAEVINFDLNNNSLECRGGKIASSESLSHAAIYLANAKVKAVMHIHAINLWEKYFSRLPTTEAEAEYGTPQMAQSVGSLVGKNRENNGVIIMGGHKEGILVYGIDYTNCYQQLIRLIQAENL